MFSKIFKSQNEWQWVIYHIWMEKYAHMFITKCYWHENTVHEQMKSWSRLVLKD